MAVVAAALCLQLFLELVVKGLGSGFSPASSSPILWMLVVPLPVIAAGLAFLTLGMRAALRASALALALHVAMAGFVWLTVSTPYDEWAGHPTTWLDDNPRIAGAALLLLACASTAGLFLTRRRTPDATTR